MVPKSNSKHRRACLFGMLYCLILPAAIQAQEAVPGEYIVLLRKEAISVAGINAMSADDRRSALADVSQQILPKREAEVIRTFTLINGVGIRVPEEQRGPDKGPRVELAATLNNDVELVEPNYIYYQAEDESNSDPIDPRIGEMWFLERIGAAQAWQFRADRR